MFRLSKEDDDFGPRGRWEYKIIEEHLSTHFYPVQDEELRRNQTNQKILSGTEIYAGE